MNLNACRMLLSGVRLRTAHLVSPRARFKCRQVLRYTVCVCFVLAVLNLDLLLPADTVVPAAPGQPAKAPGDTFPQKLWQIWKTDPTMFGVVETTRAMTWLQQNPGIRYEVITDANELTYIEERFGPTGINRPDIIEFYRNINLRIIKADLLRYMILYADGGIYADIDVEALKPFGRFIPRHINEEEYDLIIGVEVDMPAFRDHPILGPKSQSFCQWTIIARPRQAVMLKLIEGIMTWLKIIAKKQRVSIGQVELDFDQVITGTGPSAFTTAILAEMNRFNDADSRIVWNDFHDLDMPKVVGRILVLNVEAFCAGQGHSDSGNHGSRFALVKHHYHASDWPRKHSRYSHPAYGMVEQCNWNKECVDQWDKDVAEFERLSDEQKQATVIQRLLRLKAAS